ncbi:MAG: hypothetical protein ACD_75C01266G0001 [uncultured bacterium]|nr:MAG: hypothetical protein ACD_75C01266G0001 [uncultured bacterium]
MGYRLNERAEREVAVTSKLIGHRRTTPLELHDLEIDARHHLEELHPHMLKAADARTCADQFTRFLFREIYKLLDRLGRYARMDGKRVRSAPQLRDRGKCLRRIERQLIERGIIGVCSGNNQQRISVRLRLCGHFRADNAPRAAAVVDDHLLTEVFRQFGGDQAPDDIVAPARRERNDEP